MQPIVVPTINTNDTDAKLVAWEKLDGALVAAGETIAVLETTKASFELPAEADGVLHTAAAIGDRCAFGTSIGWLFADAAERDRFLSERSAAPAAGLDDLVITQPARELIARHGISAAQLRGLGRKIVKEQDVRALVERGAVAVATPPGLAAGPSEVGAPSRTATPAAGTLQPTDQQKGIARVVSRSRATIPDSFVVKRLIVDAALDALGAFGREQKAMVGLPDLVVWIAARLGAEFPFWFGALADDLTFTPSTTGEIGVTFDVGQGLYIPVVRRAATLTLPEIAKQLSAYRMRAARNAFKAEDLAGGALTISINMDPDTVLVQPIILPPQTAMLSLGAPIPEVALEADGRATTRRIVQLGAAFDHRVINGHGANAFLTAIKRRVESPDPAEWSA